MFASASHLAVAPLAPCGQADIDLPFGRFDLTVLFELDPFYNSNAFLTDASNIVLTQVPECLLGSNTAIQSAGASPSNANLLEVSLGQVTCLHSAAGAGSVPSSVLRLQLSTAVTDASAAEPSRSLRHGPEHLLEA